MYDVYATPKVKEQIEFYKDYGHKQLYKKCLQIIKSLEQNAYKCIGKPEPLKGNLSGCYSVRINTKHRMVYIIEQQSNQVCIISAYGHYEGVQIIQSDIDTKEKAIIENDTLKYLPNN